MLKRFQCKTFVFPVLSPTLDSDDPEAVDRAISGATAYINCTFKTLAAKLELRNVFHSIAAAIPSQQMHCSRASAWSSCPKFLVTRLCRKRRFMQSSVILRQDNSAFPPTADALSDFAKEIVVDDAKNCRLETGRQMIDSDSKVPKNIKTLGLGSDDILFQVSPNPAKNLIKMDLQMTKGERISIYIADLFGAQVGAIMSEKLYNKGQHALDRSVAQLIPGTYFVVLKSPTTTVVRKIAITH